MPLRSDEDVVRLRQMVREQMVAAGFSLIDQTKIVTASSELARNTLRYGGGGEARVLHVNNGMRRGLALEFIDQGPGIPAEERRRVFVRFYRLSNPETVRTRGAGIGLAILHDFAEYSHAEVHIDDAPGGGAVITVDFPTQPVETPALTTS